MTLGANLQKKNNSLDTQIFIGSKFLCMKIFEHTWSHEDIDICARRLRGRIGDFQSECIIADLKITEL